ncbi:hypothetical protein IGJ02_000205 [Enterococcus sp. DIV0724b]|uniref:hypothetical protein n=1 Tax=Enterococcus sp. DIV0724b TaxID=2774694 RepID=UPI003D2FA679
MQEKLNLFIVETKKELERLEEKRGTELGNSLNYIENEIQIQRLAAKIEAYEEMSE